MENPSKHRDVDTELRYLFVLFVIFSAIYFPMLSYFPLSMDAEGNTVNADPTVWIRQGRWAAYIVTVVFPPALVPYLTLAQFGISAAISYRLIMLSSNRPMDYVAYIAFPLFIAFPIWSFILEFAYNTNTVSVGILSCATAVFLFWRRVPYGAKATFYIVSILAEVALVSISIGLYQSFAAVYPALICATIILRGETLGKTWRLVVNAVTITLLSLIAYAISQYAFLYMTGQRISYINNLVNLDVILSSPLGSLTGTALTIFNTFTGSSKIFGVSIYSAFALTGVAIATIIFQRSVWNIFLLSGAVALPFVLVFLGGGGPYPPRALLAVPVVIWLFGMIALTAPSIWLRRAGLVAVLALGYQSASTIAQYQTERIIRSEFDRRVATQIDLAVRSLPGVSSPPKVEFFGGLSNPKPIFGTGLGSTANGSFFAWDRGNPRRMAAYMRLMGSEIRIPTPAERIALKPEFNGMPVWPAPGSIRLKDDVVLVKLSEQPGHY